MSASPTVRARRFRFIILLVITAVGAFLRLYQLESLPPAASYDVAQYGLDALQILDGSRPIFLAANFGREVLFSYLVAFVYLFTGPGAFGIHLSSALIGIATIPSVYLAAQELLAEEESLQVWAPLLAALVTALSYWHINYSRAGLRVIWVPLFAALITAFLWRGLLRSSRLSLAAAGVLLGLSLYTYQAARALPLLVFAGFGLFYLSRRALSRRDLVDVAMTFGLALLVFAPLGLFAAKNPEIFNDRLRQAALFAQDNDLGQQVAAIGRQAVVTLRMFFIEGDHEPLYTIPGRPSLNPFLAIAFLAGIVVCLWYWKRPPPLYLLTWLALLTAPAMIADMAATAKRALGAYPAVAILIALGLIVPYGVFGRRRGGDGRWPGVIYGLVVTLGLIWTGLVTYNDYFLRWGQDLGLAAYFERDHTEIGLAAAAVPGETVLISPFPASHPAIQLNSGRHQDMRSYNGHRCLIIPGGEAGITYLIVPGETEKSLQQLRELFPGGEETVGPGRGDRDEAYFTSFQIEPAVVSRYNQPAEHLLNWQDQIALIDYTISPESVSAGDTVSLTLTYRALADLDEDYTAYVHLVGQEDGNPVLVGQVDSEPCGIALRTSSWREGDTIRDTIQLHINGELPPGSYGLVTGFYTWPDITPLPPNNAEQGLFAELEIR